MVDLAAWLVLKQRKVSKPKFTELKRGLCAQWGVLGVVGVGSHEGLHCVRTGGHHLAISWRVMSVWTCH